MQPFLDALDERVLLCDGATGTLLYAQGVFINRSFDSLNLSDPARVLAVHRAYRQAGADVLETNTFGANRIKLRGFGLTGRLREINLEGARLAREAAGTAAYVAGAIGPLGLRLEPWGRTGCDEALEYFREQADALVAGGVDLFILESFRDLNEIRTAVQAVRSVCPLPVVAQMTIEEDGNSLDGMPPEEFALALHEAGADMIGLNCGIGPAHMLEALERMAVVTGARLSAQPNAGRPREVEGRTIYLTSPEYMASYARRFVDRHVRLVGGCCGTTPEHIARIRSELTRISGRAASGAGGGSQVQDRSRVAVAPSSVAATDSGRSALSQALAERRWVRLMELVPPRGHDSALAVEQARILRARSVDAVHISATASGARLSALSLAVLVRQQAGIDVVLQYSARDTPLLGIQSELLGAYAMGLRHLLAVTGDVKPVGDYPDAAAVVDVDSIGLVNLVARLNSGLDIGGQTIGPPTAFHLGVTVNPGAEDIDYEMRRFAFKVEGGAAFVVSRPIFDPETFERIRAPLDASGLPLVLSVRPFESALDAEYLANEAPGARVPAAVLERMRRAPEGDAAAREGVAIAAEVVRALRSRVHGVNIIPPPDRFDLGLAVLDAIE